MTTFECESAAPIIQHLRALTFRLQAIDDTATCKRAHRGVSEEYSFARLPQYPWRPNTPTAGVPTG